MAGRYRKGEKEMVMRNVSECMIDLQQGDGQVFCFGGRKGQVKHPTTWVTYPSIETVLEDIVKQEMWVVLGPNGQVRVFVQTGAGMPPNGMAVLTAWTSEQAAKTVAAKGDQVVPAATVLERFREDRSEVGIIG